MAQVQLPPELLGAFEPKIPTPDELRTLGVTDWGARYIQNAGFFTQFALGRFWSKFKVDIPIDGQKLVDTALLLKDAEKTWENGELGDKLGLISSGAFAAIDTLLGAMDATFGSIPIIGIVAKIGIAAQTIFWNKWFESIQPKPAPIGLKYDWTTDRDVQRRMIDLISSGDPTEIFLPPVSLSASGGEIEFEKVQDLTVEKDREWLARPKGPGMSVVGAMPAGLGIPWAWQGREAAQWSDFAPGSMQAAVIAWELCRGEFRREIDFGRIATEWYTFWSWVQKRAIGLNAEYEKTKDATIGHQRNVLLHALRPVHLAGPKVGQQRYDTGPWLGTTGFGEGRHMGNVIRDVVEDAKGPPSRQSAKKHILIGDLSGGAQRRKSSVSPVVVAGGAGLGLWLLTKVIK